MKLSDLFMKKQYKEDTIRDTEPENKDIVNANYSLMNNGNLKVELFDKDAEFKKFYDTTRLIIGKDPLYIEGHNVYNCAVSWYGANDCGTIDKKTGELDSPRAKAYKGVLAEIDIDLLQKDPNYCDIVMKELLEQSRVNQYLNRGLEDSPEIPCGKYIGGVMKIEDRYRKIFSREVGKASHDSPLMVERREQHKEKIKEQKEKDIENKRAQIEKLKSELEEMEK